MSCCSACATSLDGLSIVDTEFGPRFVEATEPRGDGAYLAAAVARFDAETRSLAVAGPPAVPETPDLVDGQLPRGVTAATFQG